MRFPDFTDEWKKVTLGEIGIGFNYGLNAPAKEYDGMNKYIRITDIEESTGAYSEADIVSPNGKLSDEYIVNNNDILLARTGASTGKSYLYAPKDGRLYFAGFLIRFNVNKANPYFIYTNLHTRNYWRWVNIMSARSGQPGINSQEYSSYPLYIPSRKEQNKIANLLQLLDERIATQNKIIEDLKKLKSAIYDVVFSSLTGRLASLGDVAEIIKGKQVNGEFLSDDGEYYVMNGGVEPSGYYHSFNTPANTISISEGGNSCGYIQWNNSSFWSGGHCYTLRILDSNIENKYLYHLLKRREVEIMKLRIGTGLPNIQKKDLAKVSVVMPSSAIQNKVISLLDSIDNKIKIEINLSFLFLRQKAYLLSKMFI